MQPNFVNQYILTDIYLSSLENPSLLTPILLSISALVNPVTTLFHLPGSVYAIKRIRVTNTGIIYHDGWALITCESGPPMRIQLPGLETIGWYDGNKAEGETEVKHEELGFGMNFMKEWTAGHSKVDPESQEILLFHCTFYGHM